MDNPVTALGRLDARQNELQAVRQNIEAIRPSTAAFENALNDAQKKWLTEAMDSEPHRSGGMTRGQQAREIASQSSGDRDNHHDRLKSARVPQWGFAYVRHGRRY